MKTIKFIISAILIMMAFSAQAQTVQVIKDGKVVKEYAASDVTSVAAQAQEEQKVEASTASVNVEFNLSSAPKFEISSDKLTFGNNTNSINFSTDERIVIRLKSATQDDAGSGKKGDVNGDGKIDISDITALVNLVLGKNESNSAKARVIKEQ